MSILPSLDRGHSSSAIAATGIVLRDFRLGGSERVAIGLANYWASLSLGVIVIVGRGTGPLRALLDPSIELIELGLDEGLGDPVLAWKLAFGARTVFRKRRIDACYVPGNSHWPVIPLLRSLAPTQRPQIVAQVSSPVCRAGRSRAAQARYDWRMRWLLRGANRIATLSEALARETRMIVGCEHVDVVPLPALWDEGAPREVPEASMTILAAGRLVPVKGFDGLIRSFRQVVDHHPQARLVLCGEGPERDALQNLAATLGLEESVEFTGYVPSIRPYLDEARLFVLSSHCESFGAVLVEALAAGRQVVATRCSPAVDDLVTCALAGRCVAVRDEDAMAKALIALLAERAPPCDALAQLVAPYHVAHGGRLYLSLMQRRAPVARRLEYAL